jgi:hypothetical protein
MEKRGLVLKSLRKKKGQVLVETVVYTLIGLTIMGILLGVVTPKLKKINDNLHITNTMDFTMLPIHQNIVAVQANVGEERHITVIIKKGELVIDSQANEIVYTLRGTTFKKSQPGVIVPQGDIDILTQEANGKYDISLILNYSSSNITFNGKDENKLLTASSTGYEIQIQNKGNNQINLELL